MKFSSTFRATSSLNLLIDTRSIIVELDSNIQNVSTADICYRLDYVTRFWYDWHIQNHHLIVLAKVLSRARRAYVVDAQKNSLNDAVFLTPHIHVFLYIL